MSYTTIPLHSDSLQLAYTPRLVLCPNEMRIVRNSEGSQASAHETETSTKRVGRVLVVDDNVDLANIAEMLLNAHGLEAIVAHSGDEALDVLAAHPEINAVVADVVMPGMNGIDLADEISQP